MPGKDELQQSEGVQCFRLGPRIPGVFWIKVLVAIPVYAAFFYIGVFRTRQYGDAVGGLCIGAGLLLLIFMIDRGYRVAWNRDAVFMRPWGYANFLLRRKNWISLRFDKMDSIDVVMKLNSEYYSRFITPISIEIRGRERIPVRIMVWPSFISKKDLSDFIIYLSCRRSDIFPEAARQWIIE